MYADYEKEQCKRIHKAPYVCNGCNTPRNDWPAIDESYEINAKDSLARI